ncbi:MAG: hypothetical protein F4X97_09905 [Boseongicola sp. SB0662_bin_57]|nr:hypothetical protein [Boseongicola sp. SB0662_bin_57]
MARLAVSCAVSTVIFLAALCGLVVMLCMAVAADMVTQAVARPVRRWRQWRRKRDWRLKWSAPKRSRA